MILWHDNIEPTYDVDQLVKSVVVDDYYRPTKIDGPFMHWSTFGKSDDPVSPTYDFYESVIKRAMSDLGLQNQSKYIWPMWAQVYEGDSKHYHNSHNHWGSSCIISWVHFIQPAEKDCFCFIDSSGKEMYPKQQRKNDIIFFPSWATHKATSFNEEGKRAIVAGNIELTFLGTYEPGSGAYVSKYVRFYDNNATVVHSIVENVNPLERKDK